MSVAFSILYLINQSIKTMKTSEYLKKIAEEIGGWANGKFISFPDYNTNKVKIKKYLYLKDDFTFGYKIDVESTQHENWDKSQIERREPQMKEFVALANDMLWELLEDSEREEVSAIRAEISLKKEEAKKEKDDQFAQCH